ncbi:MAG TPA: hypothetical protein VK661_02070 [Planctomycetota bacterium]|jgi:WD40 repeat protein|nr:hypothetical protein [Planctomycetota bacterium]
MKSAAILFAAGWFLFGDVTPRSNSLDPRHLVELRSYPAPGLWLVGSGGRFIATDTGGDDIGLLDAATGRDLGPLTGSGGSGRHDGNWGADGRTFASASNDGTVKVWDAATRKELASLTPHTGYT